MKIRVGFGYDVHRLAAGRELWLGGIKIEHTEGLLGHSDADVLIHAINMRRIVGGSQYARHRLPLPGHGRRICGDR